MNNEHVKWPKTPRLFREIIITEKLDGTNSQIHIVRKELYDEMVDPKPLCAVDGMYMWAGSRKRYVYPGSDNYAFAQWVLDNREDLVNLGEGRHFGEWWGQGIQRAYGLKEKRFSLFNVAKWGEHNEFTPKCCHTVPVLYNGEFSIGIVRAFVNMLKRNGSKAVPGFERPEGVCVFHTASNTIWKVTCENDDKPKGV